MDECCAPPPLSLGGSKKQDDAFRRVLWAVLAINAAMFAVEVIAGLAAGSAALQADALDFLGDAANYAISLLVVGMALRYRASAAMAKGATMAAFGLWVFGTVVWHAFYATLPSAFTMGTVGVAALVANGASFALLLAYRHGDANMRSAWICLAMTFSGIWRCCWPPWACSAPVQDGPISSLPRSWLPLRCKVRLS